jgi:putative hydrolase of the HAD superfamily
MRIDLVLFDLDHVLSDYDRSVRLGVLARATGRPPLEVQAALFGSGLEDASDEGRYTPQAHAARLSMLLGAPVTVADCLRARAAAMQVDRGVLALIAQLHPQLRRAVLTNNGALVTEHLARLCPPLATVFDPAHVLGSGHFGIRKPAPEVYRRCVARLGVAAGATLFIDDKAENVEGARAAGLHALHFTGATALRDAFSQYGLLRSAGQAQPAR